MAWQVNGERTRPHCIMVNRQGRRFTNEAANYNAFGAAFHVLDVTTFDYVNHPAWMVFDHHYLSATGWPGQAGQSGPTPDWMLEAPVAARARRADRRAAEALEETVARWNEHAAEGRDPDFRRGASVHDRWWGDRRSVTARSRRSARSTPRPSTPCGCTAAAWAPRAARAPTPTRRSSTSTAGRSPASTPPAT